MHPGSGNTVIKEFYQQFEDHNEGSAEGLDYFFNDELEIGVGKYDWYPDFPEEFRKRNGYDLFGVLPAMWEDMGDITPKVRMDYADVRMSLIEERYFQPIHEWHDSRGIIFGCDSGGRGLLPEYFGDYFRATRWYTAPGHDTPGGWADPIKGKVSSSIANLYQRPRVWLEGYHSLGWGASPERLMYATLENYLYGCNLLNFHGLYYSTYGSFWEWAPPCYHFRMPYWEHMDVFLKYFERLSYLMSQGHQVCDVALIYPVAPYEAGMNGTKARDTAFEMARELIAAGISFEFLDHESLAKAVVEDGLLKIKDAGAEYRALVFPDMEAVRWTSVNKAAELTAKGGSVFVVGEEPSISDRAGRNDPELERMNGAAFPVSNKFSSCQQAVQAIGGAFVQDVKVADRPVRALHRKAGFRDVYMVMDSEPGKVVEFRAKGAVELWDPWTGATLPLQVTGENATGTFVKLPLGEAEANIVVFTPGRKHVNPDSENKRVINEILLPQEWNVAFVPTMDNSLGDFRMPVTDDNRVIGVEARRFSWKRDDSGTQPSDNGWETKLYGFGTQFYLLGPVAQSCDTDRVETSLAELKDIDISEPVVIGGKKYFWRPYDFSWRWGKEGDPGHQGFHGLKRTVTDDFLCIGKPAEGLNETIYTDEPKGGTYFLWSTVNADKDTEAEILYSTALPADRSHSSPVLTPYAIYFNGRPTGGKNVAVAKGSNPLLVRYDSAGRGHLVVRRTDIPVPSGKEPLSMRWTNDEGVMPFDVHAGKKSAEWFRFTTAPGTSSIKIALKGTAQAWMDGVPMKAEANNRFTASAPADGPVEILVRIVPEKPGITGGCLIPDPVTVETNGRGKMPLGDWSKTGILNNYSGGVRYSMQTDIDRRNMKNGMYIDLGKVAGTAEIIINGSRAGVLVAPPWRLDVSEFLENGANRIGILVYNTLSNHYQTIPSNYRGDPISGLLGPVKIIETID